MELVAVKPLTEEAHSPQGGAATKSGNPPEYLHFLRKLRASWSDCPDLHISYDHLSYAVQLPSHSAGPRIPALWDPVLDLLKRPFVSSSRTAIDFTVLAPARGFIQPKKMTLVLAPPGHGKTTLLKALAGRLSHDPRLKGSLRYNNLTAAEVSARGIHIPRLCAYVGQTDVLFPMLSVRETLDFAARTSVPDAQLLKDEQVAKSDMRRADMVMEMLGLLECRSTPVGNEMMPGISGGQKKRVTLGELLVTNARSFFLDEVSTGLDAAVTGHIFAALKQACDIMHVSVVTALLQPTPETYALFDDLILLREGFVVFHGPRVEVRQWLRDMAGVEVPHGVDEAGFIVEFLADPAPVHQRAQAARATVPAMPRDSAPFQGSGADDDRSVSHVRFHVTQDEALSPAAGDRNDERSRAMPTPAEAKSNVPSSEGRSTDEKQQLESRAHQSDLPAACTGPLSAADLHAKYRGSVWDMEMQAQMEQQAKDESISQQLNPTVWGPYTRAQFAQRYSHSFLRHLQLLLSRQAKLMLRNRAMLRPRLVQATLLGVIYGTLFFQLSAHNYSDRLGLLLYVVMFCAFSNLTELPVAALARNVVVKQIAAGFYPPAGYVLSVCLVHLPLTMLEMALFGTLMYWIPAFTADAGRFLFFLLVLVLMSNTISVFFRLISYATRNPDVARQLDLPFFLFFIIFAGFLIAYNKIPVWLTWCFWISPFSWGVRSLALNEFQAERYDAPVSLSNSQRLGDSFMQAFGLQTESVWKWMGPMYLAAVYVLFIALCSCLLAYLKPISPSGTTRPKRKTDPNGTSEGTAKWQQGETAKSSVFNHNVPALGVSSNPPQTAALPGTSNVSDSTSGKGAIHIRVGGAHGSFRLSALPFEPVTLAWRKLSYTVAVSKGKSASKRKLISEVDGYAAPGRMTALMGPSGAGKTTLMDVLAGRKTVGEVEGSITVNGFPKDDATFQQLTGYVEQFDAHMGTDTVREALAFSAKLRLPVSVTDEHQQAFVAEVMELVGLTHLADRIVGDSALQPGLSPGERKLLTIGVELVANPSALFLDEPTSGLDAVSALRVMQVVCNIAATGRTILCTIHQPSARIFFLFDRLLLLKTGGQEVYFGDCGDKGEHIVHFFERASEFKERLPSGVNPANWILEVISRRSSPIDYAQAWRQSDLYRRALMETEQASASATWGQPIQRHEAYVSQWVRYKQVQTRLFVSHWRNAPLNFTRCLMMLCLGVLLGLVYLQLDYTDFAGLNSWLAVIFLALSLPSAVNGAASLPTFFRQRTVYHREKSNGMYGHLIYALSITLVELPYIAAAVFCFLLPYYFMIGFRLDVVLFFRFFLMSFLTCLVYASLAQLWLALLPNEVIANLIYGLFMSLFFVFGGMLIKPRRIPAGWKWFYYIDPVPKSFISVALGQLEHCRTIPSPCADIVIPGEDQEQNPYEYAASLLQGSADQYGPMVGWLLMTSSVLKLLQLAALKHISQVRR